jgi:hypothetical protein
MSTQTNECIECHGNGTVTYTRCNGTGKEPESVFHRVHIRSWDEISAYQRHLEGKSWIFRGQPDANKPLETSLRRHCKLFPNNLKDPKKAESRLLREFRRRFHQYSVVIPKKTDSLEWLSLMQHYGAPTRLLDFSYSILIAAYFALERSDGNCSVWAINAEWAVTKSACLFKDSPEYSFFIEPITERHARRFNKIFLSDNPKLFVCPLNPFRLTERLTLQKGVFMCPGDITATFEKNLRSMDGHDSSENMINFVLCLDKNQWRYAMDSLYNQNITRATLFPGLEGFASSLKVSPPKLLIESKEMN